MAVAAQTRPKPGGGRLLILLGAGLAGAAFVTVFVLGGLLGAGHGAGGAAVKVVVAARDVGVRTPLGKDDLVLQDFAQSDVPPHSYSKIEDITRGGLIAELNISKGQPITENMLAKSGDVILGAQPAFLPIGQGFVAVTVPTGEQQGVAGYIQAGDYINVLVSLNTSQFGIQGQSRTVTKTTFTNLHVLRVGPSSGTVQAASGQGQSSQGQAGGVATSLTVVMTECDAEYMNWFLNNTQLKYSLSSYRDYQPQDTKVDQGCPNATAAASGRGVSFPLVDQRFGFSKA